MTAFVPGADAAEYTFTSALSTQVMKHLLPTLKPLIDTAEPLPEQGWLVRASRKNVPKGNKEKREVNSS
jgi:hypothetical protein